MQKNYSQLTIGIQLCGQLSVLLLYYNYTMCILMYYQNITDMRIFYTSNKYPALKWSNSTR